MNLKSKSVNLRTKSVAKFAKSVNLSAKFIEFMPNLLTKFTKNAEFFVGFAKFAKCVANSLLKFEVVRFAKFAKIKFTKFVKFIVANSPANSQFVPNYATQTKVGA